MSELKCQKCAQQIYYTTVTGEDIVRCSNCGARHMLPNPEDPSSNWIEQSKRLQLDDDSYYRRWMPWLYRLWIGLLALTYILARLGRVLNGDPASPQPTPGFDPLLLVVMFPLLGIVLAWMFYMHTRCYGFTMSWKALYGQGDLRWFLSALVGSLIVVLAFEGVIWVAQAR